MDCLYFLNTNKTLLFGIFFHKQMRKWKADLWPNAGQFPRKLSWRVHFHVRSVCQSVQSRHYICTVMTQFPADETLNRCPISVHAHKITQVYVPIRWMKLHNHGIGKYTPAICNIFVLRLIHKTEVPWPCIHYTAST